MRRRSRESDCKIQHYTEVCTSKSDTLVTTLGPARQVCVFAHQENCQIGHSSKNPFLPGVSALSLLPVHTSVDYGHISYLGNFNGFRYNDETLLAQRTSPVGNGGLSTPHTNFGGRRLGSDTQPGRSFGRSGRGSIRTAKGLCIGGQAMWPP
jgi:hypothetical protein